MKNIFIHMPFIALTVLIFYGQNLTQNSSDSITRIGSDYNDSDQIDRSIAQVPPEYEQAGKDDILVPTLLKTNKPDEVHAGAFSFSPNENIDPKTISKLRTQLLAMKKEKKSIPYTTENDFQGGVSGTMYFRRIYTKENEEKLGQLEVGINKKSTEKLNLQLKQITENLKNEKLRLTDLYNKSTDQKEKTALEVKIMYASLDASTFIKLKLGKQDQLNSAQSQEYKRALDNLSRSAQDYYIENIKLMKKTRQTNSQVFLNKTFELAPETLTFFVATGAVTFNSMWIKSHGDPLEMERHIMSLKDPISHLSFYSFMQANGFFMNFHTGKASFATLDAVTKRQLMTRLSYQGMAVGSLASSLVADLGQSVSLCVDKWMKGKTDNASLESCDQAWKQWTIRKKVTQYFPQIISMWASQAVTEMIETNAYRAFSRMAATSFAEKYLTKKFFVSMAYKIRAADIVVACIPGEGEAAWVSKGLRAVGTLTKISLFVGVDKFMSKYINRPIDNIVKPAFFEFDISNMNNNWKMADAANWKTDDKKFVSAIEDYSENMQAWRGHLNENAEGDLSGWQEMTMKLLNQMDYAYKFYNQFTSAFFETLNIGTKIKNGEYDKSSAVKITQFPFRTFPFYGVATPEVQLIDKTASKNDMYLTRPWEIESRQKEHITNVVHKYLEQNLKFNGNNNEDTIYTSILTKLSSDDNGKIALGLLDLNKYYDDIIMSEVPMHSGGGMGMVPVSSYNGPYYNLNFKTIIKAIRAEMGNPQPITVPFAGFSQAISANTVFKTMDPLADYSQWSILKKYQFNKASDLMMYEIICGNQLGEIRKFRRNPYTLFLTKSSVDILQPEFNPPSLLKEDSSRNHFCNTSTNSVNLYSGTIGGTDLRTYFLKNFNYNIIGNFSDEYNQNIFESWWIKSAKFPTNSDFKIYDNKYKEIYNEVYDNYTGDRSLYEKGVDLLNTKVNTYLPNSIRDALKVESSVYLQLINRALITDQAKLDVIHTSAGQKLKAVLNKFLSPTLLTIFATPVHLEENDLLIRSYKKAFSSNFDSAYDKTIPEVAKLFILLNDQALNIKSPKKSFFNYHIPFSNSDNTRVVKQIDFRFIEKSKPVDKQTGPDQNKIDEERFEAYIAKSKEIDKSINDILVLAGLKKAMASAPAEESLDLSAPASDTGSENTQIKYEDIQVEHPNMRQQVIIAAVKGIRQVESELRRFIRMGTSLSYALTLDQKELSAELSPLIFNKPKPRQGGVLGQ